AAASLADLTGLSAGFAVSTFAASWPVASCFGASAGLSVPAVSSFGVSFFAVSLASATTLPTVSVALDVAPSVFSVFALSTAVMASRAGGASDMVALFVGTLPLASAVRV